MANTWNNGKFVIDLAENKVIFGVLKYFEWHPANVNDDLTIKDQNGDILWVIRAAAGAANHLSSGILTNDRVAGLAFSALNVETIDGGTLYIYVY